MAAPGSAFLTLIPAQWLRSSAAVCRVIESCSTKRELHVKNHQEFVPDCKSVHLREIFYGSCNTDPAISWLLGRGAREGIGRDEWHHVVKYFLFIHHDSSLLWLTKLIRQCGWQTWHPPPVLCPPPPETCDYQECTMITGRCSPLYSLMSNWGREVFIYCFYGSCTWIYIVEMIFGAYYADDFSIQITLTYEA